MTAEQTPIVVPAGIGKHGATPRSVHPVIETAGGCRVELGFRDPSGADTWGLTIGVFGPDESWEGDNAEASVFARLDRAQVRRLRDELSAWLDRTGF